MPENIRSDHKAGCPCPLCRLIEAYRHTEAAKHVKNIGRETFQLGRCLLDGALRLAQETLSSTSPKEK